MQASQPRREPMVTAEKKDYFNKPGKIPEILPLGYVYPKMSIGIFDSPENKSKSRSRSSRRTKS